MKATLALLIALAMFVWPTNAFGHENGKAQPRIAAVLGSDRGLMRTLTVRLRDADSGDPILNATVVVAAEMTSPHAMRTAPVRLPCKGGLYRGRVRFLMPGTWTLKIRVQGPAVVTAEAALRATVSRSRAAAPPHTTATAPAALPMNLEEELTRRDFVSMAMLWTHSIAALGWIVGVLLLLLVLVPRRPILVGSLHARLVSGYRAWGAWLHWGLIPIVVATGIYNMRFVTPFPLVWRPSELAELRDIPLRRSLRGNSRRQACALRLTPDYGYADAPPDGAAACCRARARARCASKRRFGAWACRRRSISRLFRSSSRRRSRSDTFTFSAMSPK